MLSSDKIFARFPSMNKLIVMLMTHCESNNKKSQTPVALALTDLTRDESVELMHEMLPDVTRMAALYQGDNAGAVVIVDEVQTQGRAIGPRFCTPASA